MAEEKYETRALMEFPSGSMLLPADIAVEVFKLLCKGELVQYDWEKKGYKYTSTSSGSGVSLRSFSLTDYASLALNSVPE
jgi:hypothetical protein